MAHLKDSGFLTGGARKFCPLQNEKAEKCANFLSLVSIFGSKIREIPSKTLEKWPKKADPSSFPLPPGKDAQSATGKSS